MDEIGEHVLEGVPAVEAVLEFRQVASDIVAAKRMKVSSDRGLDVAEDGIHRPADGEPLGPVDAACDDGRVRAAQLLNSTKTPQPVRDDMHAPGQSRPGEAFDIRGVMAGDGLQNQSPRPAAFGHQGADERDLVVPRAPAVLHSELSLIRE